MKRMFSSASESVLAATLFTAAVGARLPAQPARTPAATQSGQQVKLIGCVQRESDYRQARDKGRGGTAGTGIGVADEFVLTNASMATQGLKSDAGPIDTAYELTGANESKAKDFVASGSRSAAPSSRPRPPRQASPPAAQPLAHRRRVLT